MTAGSTFPQMTVVCVGIIDLDSNIFQCIHWQYITISDAILELPLISGVYGEKNVEQCCAYPKHYSTHSAAILATGRWCPCYLYMFCKMFNKLSGQTCPTLYEIWWVYVWLAQLAHLQHLQDVSFHLYNHMHAKIHTHIKTQDENNKVSSFYYWKSQV